jgi:hypothetical protein
MSLTFIVPTTLAAPVELQPDAYATTITLADIPPDFPPEAAEILVGTWVTEFTAEGTTVIYRNGEIVANGTYTSSKFNLVIRDISGPLACRDARGIATGIYTYTIVNNELHLSTVLDRCFGRMFVLTLRPMQRL